MAISCESTTHRFLVRRCFLILLAAGCGGGAGSDSVHPPANDAPANDAPANDAPANDAPIAVDDVASTTADTPLTLADATLLDNDTDREGQVLTIVAVGNPKHGSVSHAGTQVTFVPETGYRGSAGFEYTVSDGDKTDVGAVTVTITAQDPGPGNAAPVVTTSAGMAEYVESEPAVIVDPSLTISDADSAALVAATVTLLGCQDQDALVLSPSPAGITVVPYDAGRCALALAGVASVADYQAALRRVTFASASEDPSAAVRTVRFEVDDGAAENRTGSATRALHVVAVDDAPVAGDDTFSTAEDTILTIAASTLLANDRDVDGPSLAVAAVGNATHGTVSLLGSMVIFVPERDHVGPASFEYTVSDGTLSAIGAVAVTVTPVNDPPVVVTTQATLEIAEGAGPVAVDPNLAVSDVDSGTLAGATVEISAGCSAADTLALAPPAAGITVAPYDAGRCALALAGVASVADYQAALRRVTFQSTGEVLVTSTRTVRFTADDGAAADHLGSAGRDIKLTPVDTAPVAVDDSATVDEDSPARIIDVLANDRDPDGGSRSITSATQPANGTVVASAGSLTYRPRANYCNDGGPPDSFTYTLAPGGSTATVRVAVRCIPDPVVAVDDVVTALEGSADNRLDVLANDQNPDGAPVVVLDVGTSSSGAGVSIAPGGAAILYTPRPGYCNQIANAPRDTFAYSITGGSSASVAVTVNCACGLNRSTDFIVGEN